MGYFYFITLLSMQSVSVKKMMIWPSSGKFDAEVACSSR